MNKSKGKLVSYRISNLERGGGACHLDYHHHLTETYVLLREGVDELGQDLVGDDGLSELIGVVGEAAEGKSGRLLDRWHIIEEQRSQEGHNAYFNQEKHQFQLRVRGNYSAQAMCK